MRTSTSPCENCRNLQICEARDGMCVDWSRWFKAAWRGIKERALRGTAAMHLYRSGKNDREIADCVGVSSMAICKWRKRNGLPSVGKRGPRSAREAPQC